MLLKPSASPFFDVGSVNFQSPWKSHNVREQRHRSCRLACKYITPYGVMYLWIN